MELLNNPYLISLAMGLCLIGTILVLGGFVLVVASSGRKGVLGGLAVLVSGGAIIFGGLAFGNNHADGVEEAQAAWLAERGVTEVDTGTRVLGWPGSEPEEDQFFGTVGAVVDGKPSEVTLAWEDGEFVLYEVDIERRLLTGSR